MHFILFVTFNSFKRSKFEIDTPLSHSHKSHIGMITSFKMYNKSEQITTEHGPYTQFLN